MRSNQDVHILTVATDTETNAGYRWLEKTAQRNGLTVKTLGAGQRWQGFDFAMRLIVDHIDKELKSSEGIDDDSVVCVIDAYDVVINNGASPAALIEAFESFRSRLVVGVEKQCLVNCYPRSRDTSESNTTVYKYPNTGMVMGYASDMLNLYQTMLQAGVDDDQYALGMVRHDMDIRYDYEQRIVSNVWDLDREVRWIDASNGAGAYESTTSAYRPIFLHTPNVTLDKGQRYNTIMQKLSGDDQLVALKLTEWTHVKRVFKHWDNPAYVQVWCPTLVGIVAVVVIGALSVRLYMAHRRCGRR